MNFTKISRELLSSMKFRVMTDSDKMGFAGVESPVPLIAENDDEGICVIIDGSRAELYCYDGCANFDFVDFTDDINSLPYKSEKQIRIETEIANLQKSIEILKAELE